ncbi:MAG: hypothetical protein FD138_181 [Planctomycetota bacterium]|nr:MAG: hypothetical protein FD138_181 [Planctomycetota bacterium]
MLPSVCVKPLKLSKRPINRLKPPRRTVRRCPETHRDSLVNLDNNPVNPAGRNKPPQPDSSRARASPDKGNQDSSLVRAKANRDSPRALLDAANQSAPLPSQGGQPQPGEPSNDPNGGQQAAQAGGGGSGQGNMEQDRGENLGDLQTQVKKMTGRNWGQLSSKLKTELSQQAKHQAHGDYSKLIKLYFQEIAKTQPDAEAKR